VTYSGQRWVCGTCHGQYDADPKTGQWAEIQSGDIHNPCLCPDKPQPGSHPIEGDMNTPGALITP
jgi:hypothetical protein